MRCVDKLYLALEMWTTAIQGITDDISPTNPNLTA